MNKKFDEILGKSIQDARLRNNKTQQDIADRLNVTRAAIANWELGRRSISINDLFKICDILNVDPNEICADARKYLYKK